MHPPASVCQELYKVRKDLRLCWVDHPWRETDDTPDELAECGTFGIIQLVPKALVGDPENPKTFMPPLWEHVVDRGSLFNRKGGVSRDWNTCSLQPVLIAETVPAFGMHPRDIFTGRFIRRVRTHLKTKQELNSWMRGIAQEKGKNLETFQQGVSGEAADYWKWVANRDTGSSGYQGTKQDLQARIPQYFRDAMDGALSYNDYYLDAWCLR